MAELPHNWESLIEQLRHRLSTMENEEFDTWPRESPDHQSWMKEDIQPGEILSEIEIELRRDDEAIRRKFEQLRKEQAPVTPPSSARVINVWQRIGVAVALLLVAGGISYMRVKNELPLPPPLADFDPSVRQEDMLKVPEKPSLLWENGNIVRLEEIPIGSTLRQEGWGVTRTSNRKIFLFQLKDPPPASCPIVLIPYGQSWTLTWPDSSRIKLAPGSSLAWRMNIDGSRKERAFALHGEAWCEMAADPKSPVFISTLKGGVTVLGTRFDVRDRSQDSVSFVALETGKVRVNSGGYSRILRPGEEGRMSLLPVGIPVIAASAAPVRTGWLDSCFTFTDQNIKQVMEQVVQWYGLKGFAFEKNVDTVRPGLLGGGHLVKDIPLRILLKECESPDIGFHFDVDGKKIYVFFKE